jgi:hypothetical protein
MKNFNVLAVKIHNYISYLGKRKLFIILLIIIIMTHKSCIYVFLDPC